MIASFEMQASTCRGLSSVAATSLLPVHALDRDSLDCIQDPVDIQYGNDFRSWSQPM